MGRESVAILPARIPCYTQRHKRISYLKDVETLLIHFSEPKGNKNRGKVPKDADFNKVLKEIANKKNKDPQELQKALK